VAVPLAWTPGTLGGAYPWFTCPVCASRRRILRVKDGRVACAPCHRAAYRSRCERWASARSLQRAARLRRRLGCADVRPFADFPPRPRQHMAAAWYDRLVAEVRICENEAAAMLSAMNAALTARLARKKGKL
jgi:hypothetical protein